MTTRKGLDEIKVLVKGMTPVEARAKGWIPKTGNWDKPGRWVRDEVIKPDRDISIGRQHLLSADHLVFRVEYDIKGRKGNVLYGLKRYLKTQLVDNPEKDSDWELTRKSAARMAFGARIKELS